MRILSTICKQRSRWQTGARHALAGCLLTAVAGCSLAPTYHRPDITIPANYKEASGLWAPAAPADTLARGDWWQIFGDTALDGLEHKLDASNPSLAVALSRYDMAHAYEGELRSGLFPHLGVDGGPSNNRQSNNRPLRGSNQPNEYDANTAQFSADYEFDFWGRVRNEVAAGKAQAQAADADLASAKLSLQSQLADLYIQLRGYDIQAHILADSLDAYRKGLVLTQNRMEGGIASGLSVARAKNQLSDAMAQAAEVSAQRALTEHTIATLVGVPASQLSLPSSDIQIDLPMIPSEIPSTLLQRRPDIAAAERRTFAANADIGVARAAFYPSFSLSALFGWQNTGNGSLLSAGNRMWALGPIGALSLFDGGLRRSREREAKAGFDEAAGQYRVTVLTAFQQVEDNLSLLTNLSHEAHDEDDAATAAQDAATIATNRYSEGIVNYLDVVTAQTSYLQAKRNAEQVRTRRLQASVNLIRALGGGWSGTEMKKPPTDQPVAAVP
ncbi:efflux transporter outer membrane subunit [Rhodanobacter sp. MP1X3]|uniref:efflux transporter outer membrane subunit n=1 Tax=Rhodanobacter sp. MP1X3 TaxID=2723086 RepID=UPI00161F1C76|nr:efflux transporter outer membrane subunit [Rhodanobacter sp. MP1X3]MBB6244527.1 NodT family efflux transporter outer membrane factor (OMF) lipoprotein [Rhodanobacter sp. MP1X3]